MESLRSHLLVASPRLPDVNFYRSVVLIIHHDEQGAFGIVLNRPTNNTVGEIWQMLSDAPCSNSDWINLGGPVSGPLIALHTDQEHSENEVLPGVHFATHKDNLNAIVTGDHRPFRVFSGYSGWASGQLEQELKAGGWMIAEANQEDVFSDHENLWKRVAQRIGQAIIRPMLPTRVLPDDPMLN